MTFDKYCDRKYYIEKEYRYYRQLSQDKQLTTDESLAYQYFTMLHNFIEKLETDAIKNKVETLDNDYLK